METAAAAPASPAASAPAADAPAPAATLSEDARLDAALSKDRAAPAAVEPPPAEETPAEPPPAELPAEETPAEPPPPPRVAEAKRLLDQVKAKEKALADEKATFTKEVERIKGIIADARPAFDLGRDLYALKGKGTPQILARLRDAGIELPPAELAALVIEGDPDERPLTRRELLQMEKDREDRARKEAESTQEQQRQQREQAAKAARDASEQAFVATVTPAVAPTTAKVLARLGQHGRALVIDKAWAVQASKGRMPLPLLAAEVEQLLRADYPEWAPAAAPAGAATAPATKTPTAISNRAAAATTPSRPLSEEERWAQYERKQGVRK